jgi:hypothetical protein
MIALVAALHVLWRECYGEPATISIRRADSR